MEQFEKALGGYCDDCGGPNNDPHYAIHPLNGHEVILVEAPSIKGLGRSTRGNRRWLCRACLNARLAHVCLAQPEAAPPATSSDVKIAEDGSFEIDGIEIVF
jgi:hypothetical protein